MNVFDPVVYSHEENRFLLENVGKPPVVALSGPVPPGVNPRAVMPVLERVYELQQLEAHRGEKWCGLETVKKAIATWLEEDLKWAAASKRRRVRFPSLYSFDSRGRAHRYGPGSDSSRPRTYFDATGKRVPFAIELIPSEGEIWEPAEYAHADEPREGLTVDTQKNRLECFCGHAEQFKPESRASFNAARARMSKHLRTATEEVDRHREVHAAEFGG